MNYSFYLITDPHLGNSLTSIVRSAISGGVSIVQYRNKNSLTKEMINEALTLLKITKAAGIPLIINDRVDVALAINAEGVHVGQNDMPAVLARKLIGSKRILGVSVKTVEQAKQAEKEGSDYLGVGDIFGTKTKADAGKPIGLGALKEITLSVSIPVIGIGGITKENAAEVIKAGAKGIAVVSAIMGKQNPQKEAKELLQRIK